MRRTPMKSETEQWAQELFGQAELGDRRRTRRLVKIATDLARDKGATVPQACGTDSAAQEAAYRFIRNEAIEPAWVGQAAYGATVKRALDHETMVEIQDSTTLSYQHRVAEELGDLGGGENSAQRGFWVHSSLLVDAETGETVGLLDVQTWMRSTEERGQRHQRKQRAYESKESFKWQRTTEEVRGRLGPQQMKRVISVSDRESDIYQYMANKLDHDERFVVRACWDRVVRGEQDAPWERLWTLWPKAPPVGSFLLRVEQRGGRPARVIDLTIQTLSVQLKRPGPVDPAYPAHLAVNVVVATEEDPPANIEVPLEWVLLTTEPIDTPEQVLQILHYYRLRWRIEEFHKAWKTGAGVERLRLQSPGNLLRMAFLLAFVAVHLLQLRERMMTDPQAPCDGILQPLEWKVLWATVEKKPPPKKAPSVRWAMEAMARLAGWTDTKRTGRIGWATLWRGWFKLQERMEGFHVASLVGGH